MRTGRQVLITREISMPSFPQSRGADSSPGGRHDVNVRTRPNAGQAVGYGAMQLAGPYAFGPPPDRASAIGVLQAAVAAGVDHIDTAQYYGPGVVLLRDGCSGARHDLARWDPRARRDRCAGDGIYHRRAAAEGDGNRLRRRLRLRLRRGGRGGDGGAGPEF